MPAALTRVCPECRAERATPADFRDLDVAPTAPGRPPRVCRFCREQRPETPEQREQRKAHNRRCADLRAERARRSEVELDMLQAELYPLGVKVCPPLSGCGEVLPLGDFTRNVTTPDGLEGLCHSCKADHRALTPLRA
ncbi:hypothetical protein SEA_GARDENSTATE_47 [Microbacterium phage GardenState]|uniref:Uncharacterized protein n=2 Tax=Gardenstatevirus TaxID=3425012 RepID=A0A4Y6EAY0_9CAUD|nr:hypothetical protein SEA_IAMGROOT_47 [Microbacterium phage IAmGroot]QOI66959.1 hypothetical protein SEA_GARDENSTATE_47 [Microbacterium phage GardenState]